jgi:hypothetical protein
MRSSGYFLFFQTVLLTGFLVVILLPSARAQWELQKEEAGIQVFTRKVNNSSFKASKAEGIISADPESIASELKKGDRFSEWLPKTDGSEILARENEYEYYVYLTHPAPWPVSDRDEIVHYRFEKKADGSFYVYLRGVSDYLPEKPDYVRIPYSKGQWQLIPLGNGSTRVILINHFDPGGTVPAYLLNRSIIDSPIETISRLRERVEK